MLRLLISIIALIPLTVLPWMSSKAIISDNEASDFQDLNRRAVDISLDDDPALSALSECQAGDLQIFFHDEYVTSHSAQYIDRGLETIKPCTNVRVTIIPVLPEHAEANEYALSVQRMAELKLIADEHDVDAQIEGKPLIDDISSLYINGRAAIVRIRPS